jgi:multicomponent Na+:H+ antiporter subunit D
MNSLLILPIVIPMITAALMLLAYRRAMPQRLMGLIGSVIQLIIAFVLLGLVYQNGIQAIQIGGWQAPFGITIVADILSALMLCLSGVIGVASALYSLADIDRERRVYGFYPLMQILLMGVNGAFLTGDIFNLYVWFEVMLIASFVLLVLGNERRQMEGAIKYLTLNLISSAIFLSAVGILYGSVHALNMADLAQKLPTVPQPMIITLAMLFLVAFGIKAAVFPLFFWLPDSYHTPPTTVTALFAGLLTKVGVYSMFRVFTLLFVENVDYTHGLIMIIAGFTMVIGVLGAMAQMEIRRVLAFHSVSQVGYMVMGLGLFSIASIAGGIFFVLHHSLVKSNLFLISGIVQQHAGTTELKKLGNQIARDPLLAALFLVSALSLAGLPPLSGFWAKLALVQAGFEVGGTGSYGGYIIIGVSLAVGLCTLISMTKIWNEAFWKPLPDTALPPPPPMTLARKVLMFTPVFFLTALIVALGLMPDPLLHLVNEAANQLMNKGQYIRAVLGEPHESAGS